VGPADVVAAIRAHWARCRYAGLRIAVDLNLLITAGAAVCTSVATWLATRNREREKAQERVDAAHERLVETLQATVDAQAGRISFLEGELAKERTRGDAQEVRITELERRLVDKALSTPPRPVRPRRTSAGDSR
jgi:sensor domain CHASE-containing protein